MRTLQKAGNRLAGLCLGAIVMTVAMPASPLRAHDGHTHGKTKAREVATQAGTAHRDQGTRAAAPAPLPADLFLGGRIGGDFDLVDQYGNQRRTADFAGRHVLLFFGYIRCDSICSAAIPLMSQTVAALGETGKDIDLVVVTVDPENDTPDAMKEGLLKYDPRLIGLTGSRQALEPVWKSFQVSTKEVSRDWLDQPVLAHGSFVYLLGKRGEVKTLLPPILSPQQMSSIIAPYLKR